MRKVTPYILPIILGIFILLTTIGVFFSYPLTTGIGDETVLMAASLKMIAEPSLRPDYPTNYHMPLGAYLYLPFFVGLLLFLRLSGLFTSVESLMNFGILDYGKLLPMARGISIILGLACLYLIYKICRKLFDDTSVALVTTFLLATDAWFVFLSHFGKVWVPQIFTILLALYFIVRFHRATAVSLRDYIVIGCLTAAAFATHVVGLLVYLPFLVAHYYRNIGKGLTKVFISNQYLIVCNIVILTLIAFTYYLNPYGFQNYFGNSVTAAQNLIGNTVETFSDRSYTRGFFFYAAILWEYAPLLLLLSFTGAYQLFRRNREIFFILSSFVVGYYLVIGPFLGSTHAQAHYIAPLTPVLAIFAAYGLLVFWRRHMVLRTRSMKVALVLLFVLASLYPPLLFDYRLIQPTTSQEFMEWLPRNIPTGSKIVNFDTYLPINPNRASIELTQRFNPSFLLRREKYLLGLPNDEYPIPNYFVFQPTLYANGVPQEVDKNQFTFAILTWDGPRTYKESFERARVFGVTEDKLVAIFPEDATLSTRGTDPENIRQPLINLPRMTHTGPIIAIYKLR